MRTSHSTRLSFLNATVAAVLIGCGSDFGGDLGLGPGISIPDGGADHRVDGAIQPDTGATADGSAATDGNATPDVSAPDDVVIPRPDTAVPDGTSQPPDVSTPGDGPLTTDARLPGDSSVTDTRLDTSVSSDSSTGLDARIDASTDMGVGSVDARDTGPEAPTGPTCGDGHKDSNEECDDGNLFDFDGCSSICTDRRACVCCAKVNTQVLPCQQLDGEASGGPAPGALKKDLCQAMYTCVLKSRCGLSAAGDAGQFLDCYCGDKMTTPTGGSLTCSSAPAGPCIAEMEAAYEAEGATWQDKIPAINNRLTDALYGGGVAGSWWYTEHSSCFLDCGTPPIWNECMSPDPPDGGDAGGASDADAEQ